MGRRTEKDTEGGHMTESGQDGFFDRVYEMVAQVPAGMVATYGQIAKLVVEPRKARYVGLPCTSTPGRASSPAIASCSRMGACARALPLAGPRRNMKCSRARACPFCRTGASTSRVIAGPRARNSLCAASTKPPHRARKESLQHITRTWREMQRRKAGKGRTPLLLFLTFRWLVP